MKNVKKILVVVLFALVSSTAAAQTNSAELDRFDKYIAFNVANMENLVNIVSSLLEELEDGDVRAIHDNTYYWEYVYKEFKSCLDKASRDLATYNKVPPTSEELKNFVARYKGDILPSGYELLNMFLRNAKLNNYITNV